MIIRFVPFILILAIVIFCCEDDKIEQHKIVYKAIGSKMGNELHALALNTKES